jgi:serine/threonine protein kinase
MDRETETVFPESPPLVSPDELPSGTELGRRYEIVRTAGVGGSAIVYEARDHELRRTVALKILRADRVTPSALKRFRREVALARDVHCPHLARVYDVQSIDDRLSISMEFVDGETLRTVLAREGPLPVDRALTIFRALLIALGELHRNGIVHRDVKPSNILLSRDDRVLLVDLGLALRLESGESRATVTQSVVGTYEYLSPEQALGEPLEGRSDLYSAGLVLYEMLTGRLPFTATSSVGSAVARIQTRPRGLREVRRDAPRWLAQLVDTLLERDPSRRYADAETVLRRVDGRRFSLRGAWRSFRHRAVVTAALVLSLSLAAAGFGQWSSSRFERLSNDSDKLAAHDRRGRVLWTRPGRHYSVTFRSASGTRLAAAVPSPDPLATDDLSAYDLLLMDPQTGALRQTISLPRFHQWFRQFSSHFRVHQLTAADVDGDGVDEVFISFVHVLYWPSYTLSYDPGSGEVSLVFMASGHHKIVAAANLDGDDDKELLFLGINNRMGFTRALAAVDVAGSRSPGRQVAASTPDDEYSGTSSASLAWYKLLPLDMFRTLYGDRGIQVDESRREIRLLREGGQAMALGFDGLPGNGGTDRREWTRARIDAYTSLRQAMRLLEAGQPERAVPLCRRATELANRGHDRELAAWSTRVEIRASIHAGRAAEADALLDGLLRRIPAESRGGVVWDAAVAHHLSGDLERAVQWYAVGLDPTDDLAGRLRYEYLEGLVLALGESGDWAQARHATDSARRLFSRTDSNPEAYDVYINWRQRVRQPTPVLPGNSIDVATYWKLEVDLENGRDASALLKEVDAQLQYASGSKAMLMSLRAECLARLARPDASAEAIRAAWLATREDIRRDTAVRAHADVIVARADALLQDPRERDRIAREAGDLANRFRIRSLARRP